MLRTVEEACKGGVTLVQLREKNKGGREYLDKAFKVKEITDRYNVPLIIDDRVDVALACDAAGVHVGASDIPVAVARKLMGPDKIVGATAKTVEAAVKAYEDGADYLGVGAIYPTTTKVVTILTKVSTLKDICEAVPIPAVAIGGLNAGNMDVLEGAGMSGMAGGFFFFLGAPRRILRHLVIQNIMPTVLLIIGTGGNHLYRFTVFSPSKLKTADGDQYIFCHRYTPFYLNSYYRLLAE